MPEVALGFWIIRIVVTALGWTIASATIPKLAVTDLSAVPHSYLLVTPVAAAALVVLIWVQLNARHFDRWIYWLTMLAATVCGAILASLVEVANGSGYALGALILVACFAAVLVTWHRALGTIDVEKVATTDVETFYWLAIVLAQALGIELADNVAAGGFGYAGGAALFGFIVAALAYSQVKGVAPPSILFWAASVLTCPVGVGLADFLLEPLGHGGLALTSAVASAVLVTAVVTLVYILPQRSARQEDKHSKA